MQKKVVAIAADHAGFALKHSLKPVIEALGFHCEDLGTHTDEPVDYPDYGQAVAEEVSSGRALFGVVICGSGIGVSIAANRDQNVRAALCLTTEMAQLARQHNDANVLALGSRLIDVETAKECLRTFLNEKFEGGRHVARVAKLSGKNIKPIVEF